MTKVAAEKMEKEKSVVANTKRRMLLVVRGRNPQLASQKVVHQVLEEVTQKMDKPGANAVRRMLANMVRGRKVVLEVPEEVTLRSPDVLSQRCF